MIFVTGGSGLIGSFLIQELVKQGFSVKALYRKQIPNLPVANKVTWIEGDILDAALVVKELAGVTHVFHCAGLVSYAPQDEDLLQQINVEGTAVMVNACLEYPEIKLCHVSSVAAIGKEKGKEQLNESAKWDPAAEVSAYANSKYFAELEVWRGIAEGLDAVIVNPSVVLGPADWNRSSTRLFKYVFDQKPFYTSGRFNYVDVRDVVQAMLKLTFSEISGELFILNAGSVTYKAFFDQISEKLQKKAPAVRVPGSLT
ncbi:MAG: NAD-dependent epimerase/dehydratase family protein, partial [Hymenobacteraceae bacterium]|nr:NAD-dependent epimerase/dehydratase family protein [Hymenobacteraceae bacterium]MDX5397200.1 NAD-dependent epimerase/dehydratase family protein [Hymenobacteraceae bacterium]MDX5513276.1 NAD-dependent epimerase/dehydratase family protein [Hymenobacteraceae bacterium]